MKKHTKSANQLRIIGGCWRGRKLRFATVAGLRPTPDRVRETLFNWLNPVIEGARCLDLFAGSGVLGFEALSRGAGEVVLLENQPAAIKSLRDNLTVFGVENAQVVPADALRWLAQLAEPFDIVFLDPPFRQDLLGKSCELLESNDWLAPSAWIYLESERDLALDFLPNWRIVRSKTAGQVDYRLLQRR